MTDQHREAGSLGGQTTMKLYGREHYSSIGKLGGRPTWQETNKRALERKRGAEKRAR